MFVHEAQSDWFEPTPKFRGDFFGRNFYVYREPMVGIPSGRFPIFWSFFHQIWIIDFVHFADFGERYNCTKIHVHRTLVYT